MKKYMMNFMDYLFKIKLKIILSPKNVHIQSAVIVNNKTEFESDSVIYRNTSIRNSYIGKGSYIGWDSFFDNCKIGRYCSIAPFTKVIYGAHPTSEFCSTHPAFFSIQKQAGFTFVEKSCFPEFKYADIEHKKSVLIGNDVWIGQGARIMEGVTIGDGAIIGAHALVTKDVEPYSINIGMPSKCIKYRFKKDVIDSLLKCAWWDMDSNWLKMNADAFTNPTELIKRVNDAK